MSVKQDFRTLWPALLAATVGALVALTGFPNQAHPTPDAPKAGTHAPAPLGGATNT